MRTKAEILRARLEAIHARKAAMVMMERRNIGQLRLMRATNPDMYGRIVETRPQLRAEVEGGWFP